jgi:hypothetical protein
MSCVDRLKPQHIAQKGADLVGVWRIENGVEAKNMRKPYHGLTLITLI